ncbi:hypothetical protein ACFPH6_21310 [Streptomyces xiangluensis]|uniref:Uncharacterized protein n=1 Tax=Streptomyces xiangluensis TaxID=2665720 RepID=A0ABV8YP11_9ACTN
MAGLAAYLLSTSKDLAPRLSFDRDCPLTANLAMQ